MLTSDNLIATIDAQRTENGFRTLSETIELADRKMELNIKTFNRGTLPSLAKHPRL